MRFFRKISITLLIASSLILGCVSTACNANGSSITIEQSDEAAIYSAVIRQIYSAHDTFNDTTALYIIRYTDDTAGDPTTNPSEPILIPETVQSEIIAALDGLPTEIIWVESFDEVEKTSYGTVINGGVIITLGNINLQGDNSVQIPCSYYMAGCGGDGRTYVLGRVEGIWHITGTTGTMWIS